MSEFKVLTDIQHVTMRPGMYIGSTSVETISEIIDYKYQTKHIVPGLIKIIEEIYQNSVDEFIRTNGKFANKISVSVSNTVSGPKITISDNGRGIPVEKVGDSYRPVLSWTQARTGTNFGEDRVTIGMNGVGSFATAAFSSEFIGTTCDGTNKIVVTCSNNCSNINYVVSKSKESGTTVSFIPDLLKFNLEELTEDHLDLIKDRLQNLSVCYPEIQFKFNDEKIQFKNLKSIATNFSESSVTFQSDSGMFVFASSGTDEEFRCLSYVNGINIKNGGSHIDYMVECIINHIRPAIKRKWKIEVLPNQIKQHLLIASWISGFSNLKFDSQSKERITNSKAEVVENIGYFEAEAESIAKKIINTESIINPMIEAILHKQELAEKRAASAALKKVQKKRIVNHLTASGTDWTKKSLAIAEGLSAIGGLLKVRDSKLQGGYALRGKVMNTHSMKSVDIIKNKELSELLIIIGLDLDTDDYDELNYGTIQILTDGDTDGDSIFCLLLQFFSRWPNLFKQRRIQRILSPLYIAKKKNDTKLFYSMDEYESQKSLLKGYEISYNKGLGSLDENEYETMIRSPKTVTVLWEEFEKLEIAFGDSADLRKDWMING